MPLLFSYGSLQHEEVQRATFNRVLSASPDELVGFALTQVRIADASRAAALGRTHHGNVVASRDAGSRVAGMLLEISESELAAADAYERQDGYVRVAAPLASGRPAWMYVHKQVTMDFRFDEGLPVLERTPRVLRELLAGLPDSWTNATEGAGTWSAFDVVGHLIHGERTDWLPRVEHILRHGDEVPFPPFDREAMFEASRGRTLPELLDEFASARAGSLARLAALKLTDADLARTGRHPEFGVVPMREHLATWVAHDLGHLAQIVRVMARQYSDAVGPWRQYLSLLK
jgi:hypothetical protein